jgi:hypothetical protein
MGTALVIGGDACWACAGADCMHQSPEEEQMLTQQLATLFASTEVCRVPAAALRKIP